jgi:uncharacterized protein with HEPN domain
MYAKPAGRDWKMRVQDILDAVGKIKRYTAGLNLEAFLQDDKTIDAVIRNLEIIGEAASNIPEAVQTKYPDLAWLEMRGMRNIIVHEYFGVSLHIIWHTIVHDLDPLAEGLQKILIDVD